MPLENFQLSNYPGFYRAIKIISLITFLTGSISLLDFYLPSHYNKAQVIATDIQYSSSGSPQSLVLITRNGVVKVSADNRNDVKKGMYLEIERSSIFSIVKSYNFSSKRTPVFTIEPENIFSMNGFFAKCLLLSIFTLLYTNPKYWMIALSMINVVVALIFTGMPKVLLVLILIVSGTITFIVTLAQTEFNNKET